MKCEPGFKWDPTLNACVPIPGYEGPDAFQESTEKSDESEQPTDAQVKRMTKPELVNYGAILGLSLNEDDHSHDEMVDAILDKRSG